MKLTQLLQHIILVNYKDNIYNCEKFDPKDPHASKSLIELFNQPVWKILPYVIEFYFQPFYITKCETISKLYPNKFVIFHEFTEYIKDYDNEALLFDNVELALEYLKYNPITQKCEKVL